MAPKQTLGNGVCDPRNNNAKCGWDHGDCCDVPNPDWLGDGYCNIEGDYNTAECQYDGGDCCENTCISTDDYKCGDSEYQCKDPEACVEPKNTLGDGVCNPENNNLKCAWDHGDCCNVQNPDWLGDGYCDTWGDYNTLQCLWDGGDCCENTCVDTYSFKCDDSEHQCKDPEEQLLGCHASSVGKCIVNENETKFEQSGWCFGITFWYHLLVSPFGITF
jgi:hypothetical protein